MSDLTGGFEMTVKRGWSVNAVQIRCNCPAFTPGAIYRYHVRHEWHDCFALESPECSACGAPGASVKLAIFGATGQTGRLVAQQALAAGHGVTALGRDPARVTPAAGLRLVRGDVRDAAAVAQAIEGAEAVVSVLGPSRNAPDFAVSAGTANIVAAMRAAGLRRLIVTSGAAVRDPLDRPGLFDNLIAALVRRAARYVYEDMARTVALVRASDLDWTVLRVPRLTDGPVTGRWRLGYVGAGTGLRLARADLAGCVLAQLNDPAYVRRAPAVSN